jgi:hypothetical protein
MHKIAYKKKIILDDLSLDMVGDLVQPDGERRRERNLLLGFYWLIQIIFS